MAKARKFRSKRLRDEGHAGWAIPRVQLLRFQMGLVDAEPQTSVGTEEVMAVRSLPPSTSESIPMSVSQASHKVLGLPIVWDCKYMSLILVF